MSDTPVRPSIAAARTAARRTSTPPARRTNTRLVVFHVKPAGSRARWRYPGCRFTTGSRYAVRSGADSSSPHTQVRAAVVRRQSIRRCRLLAGVGLRHPVAARACEDSKHAGVWVSRSTIPAEDDTVAKLTAKQRKKIPSKDFGLPGKRKYPVQDKAHARAALSRASAAAKRGRLSPKDKAEIVRKAHARLNYGKGKAN